MPSGVQLLNGLLFWSSLSVWICIGQYKYTVTLYENHCWFLKRSYFADKGPYSQSRGFSNSHVWMWLRAMVFPEGTYGFLGGSVGEESACNVGDLGFCPWAGEIPWRKHGNPLQYSYLENSHGQRSLVGYSSWGNKESDNWVSKHSTCMDVRVEL